MRSLNKLIKVFLGKKVVVPIILILIWIFLTLFYIFNYNLSLSVISYSHSKKNFNNFNTNRIYERGKVKGEFVAKENYLGIVTISFKTFNHVAYADEDTQMEVNY